MEFEYFTAEKISLFSWAVVNALREKAKDLKYVHLESVAMQLEKDIVTNLNRAMCLAMRVNVAHSLNIKF